MGATLRRGLCLYDRAGRRQPDERPRDAAPGSCDGKPSQGRPHPDGAGGCWLLNPVRPVAAVRRAAIRPRPDGGPALVRSEENTCELPSLMRPSSVVFCMKTTNYDSYTLSY